MDIQCKACQATIQYSDSAPNFCSHCGCPLIDDQSDSDLTATLGSSNPHVSGGGTSGSGDVDVAVRLPVKFAPPERVANFRIGQELGRGGMGIVYQAEQEGTGRQVAVKLLQQKGHHSDTSVERFVQEGRVAASLSHPNSTFVYAAGKDADRFYIAMELMPGGTLKDSVEQEGKLPLSKAVDYILDVIDGLDAAHQVGIVHRDVKPSNCFLDHHGGVKVGDYGLSKSLLDDSSLTRTGTFMGTPQFAAPEQVKSTGIDHRTDIYAVGATLFYLLSGRAPFQGDVSRVIADIASEKAPRLESIVDDVPVEVDRIVAATLEKDPNNRPQDLKELRRVLQPYATGKSSFADVGRRLAAHFMDITAAAFVVAMGGFVFVMFLSATGRTDFNQQISESGLKFSIISLFVYVAYYSIAEGRWGAGIGKRIMRLRVTGMRGGRPGILRAFIRSLFVPGILILTPMILSGLTSGVSPGESPNPFGSTNPVVALIWQQLSQVIAAGLTLLCFVTMRRSNGFRGLHELVSGTRVVRLDVESEWSENLVPVTAAVAIPQGSGSKEIGGFQIMGLVFASNASKHRVYLGRDKLLARTVWLVTQPSEEQEFNRQRTVTTRSTRLHWLRGGSDEVVRWDAFEAVRGAPLVELVRDSKAWPWRNIRYPLAILAEELRTAAREDSLPRDLRPEQVWIDRTGNIKVLDFPASHPVSNGYSERVAAETPEPETPDPSTPSLATTVSMFREIVEECAGHRILPGFAAEFREQFAAKPNDLNTLDWVASELRSQPDRPSKLTWDERLGTIAASFGIEQFVFSTIAIVLSVLLVSTTKLNPLLVFLSVACFVLMIASLIGYFSRGGVVFSLTGISVRCGNRAASKIRCAVRTLIAWSASSIGFSAFGVVIGYQLGESPDLTNSAPVLVLLPLAGLAIVLLHNVAAIFAVIRPHQGLQDLLSGTYLVPK